MLNINTNLSSLIVQTNLKKSTNSVKTAIERMTTGYKINNAKDNAANYSISNNITSKLSSYSIAQDNVNMGLDLLSTGMESLNIIQQHLSRMRTLCEQAANGTYGENSLNAMQNELTSHLNECYRIYNSTEFNGINLFEDSVNNSTYTYPSNNDKLSDFQFDLHDGYIEEIIPLSEQEAIDQGYEIIGSVSDLQNIKINDPNAKYILMNDIDLSGINWTPIGPDANNDFRGEFNGNGHCIKNLKIESSSSLAKGFFGYADNATIKNVRLENVYVHSTVNKPTAALVGNLKESNVENCSVSGNVNTASNWTGGLIGQATKSSNIVACYSDCDVKGLEHVGGLVGSISTGSTLSKSYSKSNVQANNLAGGLVGRISDKAIVTDCYSKSSVSASEYAGGLIGRVSSESQVSNSYAKSNVIGQLYVGGLLGRVVDNATVQRCFADSYVNGYDEVGGFVGKVENTSSIYNSYSKGSVTGVEHVGGFVGKVSLGSEIKTSKSETTVSGDKWVGGFVGYAENFVTIELSKSDSYVQGRVQVGGFVGRIEDDSIISGSLSKGRVHAEASIGGFAGYIEDYASITDSKSDADVVGERRVGGFAGEMGTQNNIIQNCKSTGSVMGYGSDEKFLGVGGLVGVLSGNSEIISCETTSSVVGKYHTGAVVGIVEKSSTTPAIIKDTGYAASINPQMSPIGTILEDNIDLTTLYDNAKIDEYSNKVSMQVGINSDNSSKIIVDTGFKFSLALGVYTQDIARSSMQKIDNMLAKVNEKQTALGADFNRMESALESIRVNIDNLTSTRSTIQDADITEVSSAYIRNQILQQASATLLSTANQTPSIALQLI